MFWNLCLTQIFQVLLFIIISLFFSFFFFPRSSTTWITWPSYVTVYPSLYCWLLGIYFVDKAVYWAYRRQSLRERQAKFIYCFFKLYLFIIYFLSIYLFSLCYSGRDIFPVIRPFSWYVARSPATSKSQIYVSHWSVSETKWELKILLLIAPWYLENFPVWILWPITF